MTVEEKVPQEGEPGAPEAGPAVLPRVPSRHSPAGRRLAKDFRLPELYESRSAVSNCPVVMVF